MDKNNWTVFLASKIKSQISLENSEKTQNWALTLFGFLGLGFALNALIGAAANGGIIYASKILFLIFFHVYALTQFFIPGILQKGQKPIARQLQLRDITSLTAVSFAMALYCVAAAMLSHQAAAGTIEFQPNAFLVFTARLNEIAAGLYALGALFYLTSLSFFPSILIKWVEKGSKSIYVGLGCHAALLVLTALAYMGVTRIGSPEFFEQFRIAGLFWVFIGTSVLLIGRVMRESAVPALSNLEMDLMSGRLERTELVVPRFKDAFVSARFENWLKRYSKVIVEKSAEIARLTKETLALVSVEKPSEMDLRQVEIRYHRAEIFYKQLEKSNQRFMVSMVAFYLTDVETEKAALLRDQFSRELRNAKLELASIRKMTDERLVSLKNSQPRLGASSETQSLEELTQSKP